MSKGIYIEFLFFDICFELAGTLQKRKRSEALGCACERQTVWDLRRELERLLTAVSICIYKNLPLNVKSAFYKIVYMQLQKLLHYESVCSPLLGKQMRKFIWRAQFILFCLPNKSEVEKAENMRKPPKFVTLFKRVFFLCVCVCVAC